MSYVYGPPPPPPSAQAGAERYPNHNQQPHSYSHSHHSGHRGGSAMNGRQDNYYGHGASQPYDYAQPAYGPPPAHYGQPAGHHQSQPPSRYWPQEHNQPAQPPVPTSGYNQGYAAAPYPPAPYAGHPYPAPQAYPAQYPPAQPPHAHNSHASAPPRWTPQSPQGYQDGRGHSQQPPPMAGNYGQPYNGPVGPTYVPTASYPYAPPPQYSNPPTWSPNQGGNPRHQGRGGYRDGPQRGRHSSHHHGGRDRDRDRDRQHSNNRFNHGHGHGHNGQNRKQSNSFNKNHTPQKPEHASGKKKKRKTNPNNSLGLTPAGAADSDNESTTPVDDNEEKALLKELEGTNALFVITDAAAYLQDRRKKFPTAARVKENEAAKKRAVTDSSAKRKRDQKDEGDEMRDSVSDGEPEVQSTRQAPPPTPAVQSSGNKADISRHCKYYSTGGTCGKKGKCRFVHDLQVREAAIRDQEANNGQLTIRQRLALNDKGQDDLTVLKSVQYLLDQGVTTFAGLHVSAAKSETPEADEKAPAAEEATVNGAQEVGKPEAEATNGMDKATEDGQTGQLPLTTALGNAKENFDGWATTEYDESAVNVEDLP